MWLCDPEYESPTVSKPFGASLRPGMSDHDEFPASSGPLLYVTVKILTPLFSAHNFLHI